MEVKIKKDRRILDKYLKGKTIKTALQTPFKTVRGYLTEDDYACYISPNKERARVSVLVAITALQKGWKFSIQMEGSDLVCILSE